MVWLSSNPVIVATCVRENLPRESKGILVVIPAPLLALVIVIVGAATAPELLTNGGLNPVPGGATVKPDGTPKRLSFESAKLVNPTTAFPSPAILDRLLISGPLVGPFHPPL